MHHRPWRVPVAGFLLVLGTVTPSASAVQAVRREPTAPPAVAPTDPKGALVPGEPPVDGTPVIVIDATSGEPVAGALVTWFDRNEKFSARVLADAELKQQRIEHGHTVRSDAKGQTTIGRGELVIASAGDRFAARRPSRGAESPMRLVLAAARRVQVEVVDAQQQPLAGVPIALATGEGPQGPDYEWHVTTGADGKVAIGPLDLYIERESRHSHELHVRVDAPLGEIFDRELDDRQLPAEPIRFTLPPTGRLVIDVVDEKGEPLHAQHWCSITPVTPVDDAGSAAGSAAGAADPMANRAAQRRVTPEWRAYDDAAHYELPFVTLGRRFEIECMTTDDGYTSTELTADGPKAPGERMVVRVVCTRNPSVNVIAHLTDATGKPVARASITVEVKFTVPVEKKSTSQETPNTKPDADDDFFGQTEDATEREVKLGSEATTDEEGFLDVVLRNEWIEKSLPVGGDGVVTLLQKAEERGILASGEFEIPAPDSAHRHDLGTVLLAATPQLVAGQVVDDAGTPVAGAPVTVAIQIPEKPSASGDTEHVVISQFGEIADQLLTGVSGSDGSFSINGPTLRDANYSVSAGPPDLTPAGSHSAGGMEYEGWASHESSAFDPGDEGVKLLLWRAGTIAGSIVGDPDELEGLSFKVSWRRTDGEESGFSGGDPDTTFEFTGVPHGIAKVELQGSHGAVATIDGIVVEPGVITRLPPIVLGAAKHTVVLTIRDADGQPIDEGWVTMPDKEEEEQFARMAEMFKEHGHADAFSFPRRPSATRFTDGQLTLRGEEPFRAIAVGAAGFASQVLHDAEGPLTVTLRPAPKVALVLDLEGDDPPKPLELIATFAAPADDPEWFRFGPDQMFTTHREARVEPITLVRGKPVPFKLWMTGRVRLGLVLGERHGSGYGGRGIDYEPFYITVEESRDEQLFHVRVSAEALRMAVKAGEQ